MIRILLAAATVFAVMASDVRLVQAREAPWCAVISLGRGDAYWDCQYASIEACRVTVVAGNRGFCNPSPWYTGGTAQARKARRARRH
jgi:hypothetical protein